MVTRPNDSLISRLKSHILWRSIIDNLAASRFAKAGPDKDEEEVMFSHPVSAQIYLRRLCIAAALMMVAAGSVQAQALYGSLVGNVVDDSGAIVPGATVTITHKETNQTREQSTPENGTYSFPNLAPGTYDVVVTLPGFKTFATRDITVNIGAIVRVDA
jgi:hypothetical protein